jgi:predicted ABC-type ATPase
VTGGERPTLTVIAGPNGAGKSTLTASLHDSLRVPVIDPDAIARSLRPAAPEQAAMEAGREVIRRQIQYLESGTSFALETTLAGTSMLRYMEQARQRGFGVHLIYIGIDNVQTTIDRIAERVARGGHHVPAPDVRRRYTRSMRNLARAIERADHATIIDNSSDQGPREVLTIDMGRITAQVQDLPAWVTSYLGAILTPWLDGP